MKTFKTIDEISQDKPKTSRQKLSVRQIKFIGEILKGRTQVQAAKNAGYSTKITTSTVQQILASEAVQEAIEKGKQKLVNQMELNAKKVLGNIERIASLAEDAGDYGNALRGNEMLGKHLKLFTDRIEHSGSVSLVLDTGIRREPKVIDMDEPSNPTEPTT